MKNSRKVRINDMPFFSSMQKVQTESGIDEMRLILWQVGFKADPLGCTCGGHDWSAFDLMLESVNTGHHDWEFYRTYSPELSVPDTFRFGELETGLLCPVCNQRSGGLTLLYNYAKQCCD